MTTVAKKSVLDMMDEAIQESATKATGGFKPTFLTLKDKQKAILRPLFNLDQAIPLMMHNKFNKSNPKDSINAVCAQEIGKPCALCGLAAEDKQLRPALSLMLPVYVYRIGTKQPDGSWADVTYKNAEDQDVRVQGLRILELKQYGTITAVYQTLRTYYRDYPSHDIGECDFSIERVGAMQNTSYALC